MTMTIRSIGASVLLFVRVLGIILLCRQQLYVSSDCLMKASSSLTLKNFSGLLTANTSVTLRDLLQQLVHSVTISDGGKLVDQVHLDLSRNGIKDFDLPLAASDSFTNIVVLDISDNELEHLTEKVLSNFPNVWYVNLAFNAISVISDKSLPDSVRLLNISGNRLRRLERGMFNNSLQNLTASRNRISELLPGSLPTALTCLDLSFNEIRILLSGVFANLTALRTLNLSHNQLSAIQPHAFYSGMTLRTADLSFNSLTSYEPWPYLFTKERNHIKVDLQYNSISRFTNDMNMTVIRENKYTRVDLRHNALRSVTSQDLSIYFGGHLPNGFQVDNLELNMAENPWVCDCALYGLVVLYNTSFLRILAHVKSLFTCQNPPTLRGKTFGFLIDNPDSLTCRLTRECPHGCSCQDRPHRGYVEVYCDHNQHVYAHLPAALPSDRLLFLNLSGHQLQALDPAVLYASRLYGLDVSHNHLQEVTSAFLDQARGLVVLDLGHNQLTSLPPQVRKLSLHHLHVAGNPLHCSCSFVWFGEWLGSWAANVSTTTTNSRKSSSSLSGVAPVAEESMLPRDMESLTCQQPGGGLMIIVDMSDKSLGCEYVAQAVVAGVCCMLLLVLCIAVAGWHKRYELRVWLHFRTWGRCCGKVLMGGDNQHSRRFNVYISVDEEDAEAVDWVLQVLLPFLEGRTRPLRVYLPVRQEIIGESKANARADTIADSHNMLVLLTPGYVQNEWCRFEFDQACRQLEEESAGKLVLLKMAGEDYRNGEQQVDVNRLPGGKGTLLPATEGRARRCGGAEDHQHAQQNGTDMRPASALQPNRDTVLTGASTGENNRSLFEAATTDLAPGPLASTTTTAVHIYCNPELAAAVPEHLPLDARHSRSRSRQVVARALQCQRALLGCSLVARFRCWCRCRACRGPGPARRTHTNRLELAQFYDVTGQPETLESLSAFLAEGKYISLGEHFWREKVFYELSTNKKI